MCCELIETFSGSRDQFIFISWLVSSPIAACKHAKTWCLDALCKHLQYNSMISHGLCKSLVESYCMFIDDHWGKSLSLQQGTLGLWTSMFLVASPPENISYVHYWTCVGRKCQLNCIIGTNWKKHATCIFWGPKLPKDHWTESSLTCNALNLQYIHARVGFTLHGSHKFTL